MLLSGG
jgi:hypothetical protein